MIRFQVDYELCDYCGHCVDICPGQIIKMREREIIIDPEACMECQLCEVECQKQAIKFVAN